MGIKVSAVSTEAREGMPRRVPDMAGWRGQDWGHQGLRVSGVPTVLCPVLLLLLPESGAGVCVCVEGVPCTCWGLVGAQVSRPKA